MKFRFTLQAVLDQREHLQHDAELALGKAMQAQGALERAHQELKDEFFHLTENRGGVQFGDGERMMDYIWYAQRLKQCIAKKKQEIEEHKAEVEKARLHLVKRTQEKRAIEILREGQLADFKLKEKRQMEKRTDESGQTRFARADKEFT